MNFLNHIPTRTIEVIDFEAIIEQVGLDKWVQVKLTYSQRNSIAFWLKKNRPEIKLHSRQLSAEFQLAHKEPRPYMICFTNRKEPTK